MSEQNDASEKVDQIKKAMSTLHAQLLDKEKTYKEDAEKAIAELMKLIPGIDQQQAMGFINALVKVSHDYTSMINLMTQIEIGKMAINSSGIKTT